MPVICATTPMSQEQPTMALRWFVTRKLGIRNPKLQQAWEIIEYVIDVPKVARIEWRDVPTEYEK